MLALDGPGHATRSLVRTRFTACVEVEVARLVDELAPV